MERLLVAVGGGAEGVPGGWWVIKGSSRGVDMKTIRENCSEEGGQARRETRSSKRREDHFSAGLLWAVVVALSSIHFLRASEPRASILF
jgi:hypothetical protein